MLKRCLNCSKHDLVFDSKKRRKKTQTMTKYPYGQISKGVYHLITHWLFWFCVCLWGLRVLSDMPKYNLQLLHQQWTRDCVNLNFVWTSWERSAGLRWYLNTDVLADINHYQLFFMSSCFLIPTHNLIDVYVSNKWWSVGGFYYIFFKLFIFRHYRFSLMLFIIASISGGLCRVIPLLHYMSEGHIVLYTTFIWQLQLLVALQIEIVHDFIL